MNGIRKASKTMDNDDKTILGCFGLWVGIIGTIILGTILNGWALATLWGWFITPIFGWPHLNIAQAIGVTLIVGYLTKEYQVQEGDKDVIKNLITLFIFAMGKPVLAVGMGWVIVRFIG